MMTVHDKLLLRVFLRVFKFDWCLVQIIGYFKHLCQVLFVFQILSYSLYNYSVSPIPIWSFWGNKWTPTDEKINKQCVYYMYLLSFEAKAFFGESLLMCMDCHLKVQISSHVHSFQDMKQRQRMMLFSFHSPEVTKTTNWENFKAP